MKTRNQSIRSLAVEVGKIRGHEYWIVPNPVIAGLNGYIVFKARPVKEMGCDGVLTYVPVHGGITYAEHDTLGSVYGFDTSHFDSDSKPRDDKSWIKGQCKILLDGILLAKKIEKDYLLAEGNNKKRGKILQPLADLNKDDWQNFGVSINLLSGKL